MKTLFVGIDIGSVSVNFVLMDKEFNIIKDFYIRHKGQPLETVHNILTGIEYDKVGLIAATGSGGRLIAEILGGKFINEIIAHSRAVQKLNPKVKTVIEMGGQDAKLLVMAEKGIEDFTVSSACAAGTGSFLDQQANRLNVNIESEFGQLALKSDNPPRIAGRCSVFAKSDMIHLQQVGTPDYDIVAGLCYAVARNFKSNIAKGKIFERPIMFQGGVAANAGVVKAFEDILGLKKGELIIPEHYTSMGAIGAVLKAAEQADNIEIKQASAIMKYIKNRTHNHNKTMDSLNSINIDEMVEYLANKDSKSSKYKTSLSQEENELNEKVFGFEAKEAFALTSFKNNLREKAANGRIDAYLGIDIGSLSTNLVLINKDKEVLSRRYLMTAGRPIEAVKRGLRQIANEADSFVTIKGVGTTGSGRYMIGDFVGADVVKNEITAQATAAISVDKTVDTIFEIGGQDSKFISIENGVVVDFEMNKACAAGTGSFLEEQAERLDINIVKEFADMALKTKVPSRLGERCTVFIESDLLAHQQSGVPKDSLVAGLAYSIVNNYLNRVVVGKHIGDKVFFQGGVAWNKSVAAAFSKVTGKKIIIPPHHDVSGAIGAAILSMEEMKDNKSTKFKGFDLSDRNYESSTFECNGCDNVCGVTKVTFEGEQPLFYGTRCEKYEKGKKQKTVKNLPDLFKNRDQFLFKKPHHIPKVFSLAHTQKIKIGIPRVLHTFELFAFWKAFFSELDCEVVLSKQSNNQLIHLGVENNVAETCFPIKVAHGHIFDLFDKKVDYIFLPSVVNMHKDDPIFEYNYLCPYVQTIPYMIRSAINFKHKEACPVRSKSSQPTAASKRGTSNGVKLLTPVVHFERKKDSWIKELEVVGDAIGKNKNAIKRAVDVADAAYKKFKNNLSSNGKDILKNLDKYERVVVILSRPYNGCDAGINLNLPAKLGQMGVVAIPMDFLPLEDIKIPEFWQNMFWKYGQKVLKAAKFVAEHPKLHAIYITNFGCGPDSFLLSFVKRIMSDKPFLQLEIDEHSADAGLMTRCEAFLDSLENRGGREEISLNMPLQRRENKLGNNQAQPLFEKRKQAGFKSSNRNSGLKVYIPNMCDHVHAISSAFRACGMQAEVLPPSDAESLNYGRQHTSGKECFPCIITTGDMVRKIHSSDFNPEKSAFFMPQGTGPCRFGQYNNLHSMVLEKLGYHNIAVISPNQGKSMYEDFSTYGQDPARLAWQGMVGTDILEKALLFIRPYEKIKGITDQIYQESIKRLCWAIENKEDVYKIMKINAQEFMNIAVDRTIAKPKIGIVGEIYVRSHKFSNNNLVRKLESFGAEVQAATFGEWIYYTNFTRMRRTMKDKEYIGWFKTYIKEVVQKNDESKMVKPFLKLSPHFKEPSVKQLLKLSAPYIDDSFEGEAVLSIGKAIEYYKHGCSGIINVLPFTCMPGNIVASQLKRLRQDCNNIPLISIAYDGQEDAIIETRLEAFVHQAAEYAGV